MVTEELAELEVGMGRLETNTQLSGEMRDGEDEGVLLYYKFAPVSDPVEIKNWLFELSSSMGLLGRIRVAPDGINITVGGKMSALREHVKVVGSHPLFEGADFKLASCSHPTNPRAAAECGFTSLSARIVKELVTLGINPSIQRPSISNAGRHVTAQEFHGILQDAGRNRCQASSLEPSQLVSSISETEDAGTSSKNIVVVDARNVYETRIGKFSAPHGVEVMDPMVRQYSDLPGWIDANEDHLRNKRILMYCTGGVRCEMASAYIRSKGKDFEDVLQLSGGIQRYLEAFPDGGFFTGKNFVFDHRLAVSSSNPLVLGSCLLCKAPFDDYSCRCRCSLCRMLILVCGDCQVGAQHSVEPQYICEVCSDGRKTLKPGRKVRTHGSRECEGCSLDLEPKTALSETKDENQGRKLRILCLHGFRQSASSLKGRLNALRKKLKHKVELVYVDAPHEVNRHPQVEGPLVRNLHSSIQTSGSRPRQDSAVYSTPNPVSPPKVSKKYAWLISDETETKDAPSAMPTIVGGGETVDSSCQAQASDSVARTSSSVQDMPGLLTSHSELDCSRSRRSVTETSILGNVLQFQTQTGGWSKSWDHLQRVFTEMGPFDGLLGFSQGAAIAAALSLSRSSMTCLHAGTVDFRFVILCSGFWSPAVEHSKMKLSLIEGAIDCPSLHVFGDYEGLDRQISVCESEQLATFFRPDKRTIVRHQSGHIIPTQPQYVRQYLDFFEQFQ